MSEAQGYSTTEEPGSGNGAGPHVGASFDIHESHEHRQGRPEVAVGAAFVGGFLLAVLLRRARS